MDKLFINEGSTAFLSITFRDKDGNPAAPATVLYDIHNMTNNSLVRASTPIGSVSSTIEIELETIDTVIVDQANAQETCRVTLMATYGNGDQLNSQIDYIVQNLSQVA